MCSASRACISVVVLVRLAITIEMPIELPMLRTRVSMAVPLLRNSPGSVANATVESGTNTRPRPAPWMMPVTTMVRVDVSVVKPDHLVERRRRQRQAAEHQVRASTNLSSRPTAIIAISVPTPREPSTKPAVRIG